MSKTGEILDTNYDQQVQEVLGAARSKGVSGPALQVTLQKAKEARASAMAGAYRDALIERANSGLKTSMDAITSASNLLTQLFDQQRVLTTDVANVMRETVEAPFRNYGTDSAQAGEVGGGSGGGRGAIVSQYLAQEPLGSWGERMAAEQAAQEEAQARAADLAAAKSQAEFDEYWAKWGVNGTNAQKQADAANAGKQLPSPTTPGAPGTPVPLDTADQRLADSQNTASWQGADGKFYSWVNGKITVSDSGPTQSTAEQYPGATRVDSPFRSAADQVGATGYNTAPAVANAQQAATRSVDQQASIQAAVKNAMAPLSATGSAVLNQFKPAISTLAAPKVLGPAYNNGLPYEESTLSNPAGSVSAGGGGAEASRGQGLVETYGMDKVVGTSAGYGVRSPAVKGYGGAGTDYGTPTGFNSLGAHVAQPAKPRTSPGSALADAYNEANDPYANASATGYRTSARPASSQPSGSQGRTPAAKSFGGLGEASMAGEVSNAYAAFAKNGGTDAEWNALMKQREQYYRRA